MKKFLFKGITVLVLSFFVLSGSTSLAHASSGSSDASQVRMEQLLKIIEQLTAILKELQSRAGVPSSQGTGKSLGSSDDDDAELEIEIEIRTTTSKVKVKQDHDVDRFVVDSTDQDEIIAEIANRTGLSETEVRANASFEGDDESDDDSTDDHGSDDEDDEDDDHGGNSGHGGGSDD